MTIPVAIAYSPKTQTSGVTAIDADVIVIDDTVNEGIESFPAASLDAPGEAVLSPIEGFASEDPADYETIRYTERDVPSKELRGVTRGVEGTAREWPDGTWIASFTSADAWNEMRESHLKQVPIEDNITVTVGSGGDFNNINDALEYLTTKYPAYVRGGYNVVVNLLSGFVVQEQVIVDGIDLSWITITSVDAEVVIDRQYITEDISPTLNRPAAFAARYNGALPIIDVLFNMNTTGIDTTINAFTAHFNSKITILPGAGCKNASLYGVYAANVSLVHCHEAIFDGSQSAIRAILGSTVNALRASLKNCVSSAVTVSGSTVIVREADLSGSGSNGIYATRMSHINAHEAVITNAAVNGIFADQGSVVEADLADVSDATERGFCVEYGSSLNAANAKANDCGTIGLRCAFGSLASCRYLVATGCSTGIQCAHGSTTDARDVDVSGALSKGVQCMAASSLNAQNANAQKGASPSTDDIEILDGGIINALDATGGKIQDFNTLTFRGIIFGPA